MLEMFYTIRKAWYMILAVIGVPANLVAIAILPRSKCGLSTCTIRYLVAMAVADLLIIIFDVMMKRINFYYFPGSLLNVTYICTVFRVLTHVSTDMSVWFTVTFTFDRFVAICCHKLKSKYCTEKSAAMVLSSVGILLCLKNVPIYFLFEPGEIINKVPWFCKIKPGCYTEPGWVGYDWFDTILNPLLPFVLILILNALTIKHILLASRVRKGLRGQSMGSNRGDPEMETRKRSMILLFTVSSSFIFLWLTYVLHFLYYNITGMNPRYYSSNVYIFKEVGFMLRILSCCTNTFIYGVTQSKFREQLVKTVENPFKPIIQHIKDKNK
ncbi:probable G-protein coupled receptor 139 [Stegostoma tigrinum]|uniref:probable G-protein coupled receptor 139 n=1 Tax=Stegostoma tigrinum TaxID=3053191 RepID=UPI00202AFB3B|nr:probable G-protein coupled receptor 139 [Stegostoma tigrinum]